MENPEEQLREAALRLHVLAGAYGLSMLRAAQLARDFTRQLHAADLQMDGARVDALLDWNPDYRPDLRSWLERIEADFLGLPVTLRCARYILEVWNRYASSRAGRP